MWMRRRVWFRGRTGRGSPVRRGEGILLSAVLGIGLALLAIHMIDGRVRPIVIDMAGANATNAVTRVVNDAVSETLVTEAISYPDMVTLQTDASGQITALTSNFSVLNGLRTRILGRILEQVDSLDNSELGVPLGNLLGPVSLSGRGPILPVSVLSATSAEGRFRNEFTSAGINQSYHRVVLDVEVTVRLLIPGGRVETQITVPVSVAETVIVGKVPDSYLQLGLPSQ